MDTIHGGADDDRIVNRAGGWLLGDNGNDTITGLTDAATFIDGGPGDDQITGGLDNTTVGYLFAISGVNVGIAVFGPQAVGGGMGTDTLRNVNFLVGSGFNDTLTGGEPVDGLVGGSGDDRLQAGLGADTFYPGAGDDVVTLASRDDTVAYGDFTSAGIIVSGATGPVTVDLRIVGPQTVGGGMGVDVVYGAGNLSGGRFSDILIGSDARNVITGEDGDDTLNGVGGDDFLDGGLGNNQLLGGDGDDHLFGRNGQTALYGENGDDTIEGGSGFDDVNGGAGADSINAALAAGNTGDRLRGGQGDDVIIAGAGNDYISGDRGSDTETGGAGADIFHSSQNAGVDRVLDFHPTEGDRVMLDAGTTYTVSQVGGDTMVDMGGGNEVVLVGVQMSSLSDGWIFTG
jgi:Ca2+-binding RTX toxin-like protein